MPLADTLRPTDVNQVVGHQHLMKKDGLLSQLIQKKKALSLVLYGPPGCGKTSLAALYAKTLNPNYLYLSATLGTLAPLKKALEQEASLWQRGPLIVFLDEIHRLNKGQQDFFLPYVEKGSLILIGTTTENPAFSLNPALISRLRILQLKALEEKDLQQILQRFLTLYPDIKLSQKVQNALLHSALGDARSLLNLLENLLSAPEKTFNKVEDLQPHLLKKAPSCSKDLFYALASAFQKSIRGSDPQATLYWLSRMLEAGVDPKYILRRLSRIASEDIGLADPQALLQVQAASSSFEIQGPPEGLLVLAQASVYLALSPKSNALYTAFQSSLELAQKTSHLMPPDYLMPHPPEATTESYLYNHDLPDKFSGQNYMPPSLSSKSFYQPGSYGFEKELKKRIEYFEKLSNQKKSFEK